MLRNLVYKGNLNLVVTGDYNVDVGGNYNVQVAGNMIEGISENHRTFVTKNSEYVTKGTKSTKTIANHTDIMLADNHQYVKANQNNWVQGDIEIATEQDMFVSAKSSLAMTSEVFNATGVKQVSIFGMKVLLVVNKLTLRSKYFRVMKVQHHLLVVPHSMVRFMVKQLRRCSQELHGRQKNLSLQKLLV